MAPAGLVISKLAIQATASDEVVKGLLCLKVSLPRESEGKQATRWALFSSTPPKLTCSPAIHALPLGGTRGGSKQLKVASRLLGIEDPGNSHSSSSRSGIGAPYLDVSSTNGQVYVVMEGGNGRRRGHSSSATGGSTPKKGDRKEYLLVLEFESRIDGRPAGPSSVSISLPKCLDNIIRFQISSNDEDGEVSIMTEPKLLPLPPSSFSPSRSTKPPVRSNGLRTDEEGWEDGEDLSEEEGLSDGEQGQGEGEGSWLEGRFQSTDTLRLEWSFAPSASSSSRPILQITPIYDRLKPSIQISYEAPISSEILETFLPDGWGFSSLSINAPGLQSWTCNDGSHSDGILSSSLLPSTPDPKAPHEDMTYDVEDSFATIRAPRRHPSILSRGSPLPQTKESKASLMRQTIPDMKVEEFSFELNDDSILSNATTMPLHTPNGKSGTPSKRAEVPVVVLDRPMAARTFELDFSGPVTGAADGLLRLEAVLVPLSRLSLVSPSVPVQLPQVQYGEANDTLTICPCATYGIATSLEAISLDTQTPAYFSWSDSRGTPISSKNQEGISGEVDVRITIRGWTQGITIDIPPSSKAGEVSFTIPRPVEDVKLVKAICGGRNVARSILPVEGAATKMFFSTTAGRALSLVLEVQGAEEGEVILPHFEGGGQGRMAIHLPSSISNLKLSSTSTLKHIAPLSYTYSLSSPSRPILSFLPASSLSAASPKRSWGLFSWNTLINLFMLWLVLSMGQQVQRLRTELAWIADETRDLRMYNDLYESQRSHPPSQSPASLPLDTSNPHISQLRNSESVAKTDEVEIRQSRTGADMSTALGRVVFGRSGWDRFSSHPT